MISRQPNGYAHISLGDGTLGTAWRDARRLLRWIDAEDVARGAVQADQPEVAWLMNPLFVVEEEADVVGRIIALRIDLLVGEKLDFRIGVAKQQDHELGHRHA
jgi:hypothetical protein